MRRPAIRTASTLWVPANAVNPKLAAFAEYLVRLDAHTARAAHKPSCLASFATVQDQPRTESLQSVQEHYKNGSYCDD